MTDFVVADSGIRQLHARFGDAVWRQDAEAFADCFAEDAEWKIATLHFKNRAEIRGAFGKLMGACAQVRIIPGIPLLEVDGSSASSRMDVTEFAKMNDGSSAMTLGVYFDCYVECADGRWRFRHRHFGLRYRGPVDFSAELVDSPDYGAPPAMPGEDDPTFTRRAL